MIAHAIASMLWWLTLVAAAWIGVELALYAFDVGLVETVRVIGETLGQMTVDL